MLPAVRRKSPATAAAFAMLRRWIDMRKVEVPYQPELLSFTNNNSLISKCAGNRPKRVRA